MFNCFGTRQVARFRIGKRACVWRYNEEYLLYLLYCTFRTNTVVLVDATGHATYVERTLEDDATDPDEAEWRISTHEFDIQEACDCHDENHNISVVFNSSL